MFELLNVVASSNLKASSHLNSFRLKDGKAYATNNMTTFCASGLPIQNIDCLVDAPIFMKSWLASKEPVFTQIDDKLQIKDNKMTVKVGTFEPALFPETEYIEPTGESLDASEKFVQAIKKLSPFLKNDNAQVIIAEGYAYITDRRTLVRTSVETTPPELILLSRSVVDLIAAIKREPIDILIDDNSLSVIFEDCWLRTSRYAQVGDASKFAKFFENFDSLPMMSFDIDVLKQVLYMCSSADKDDTITTSSKGIVLNQGTRQVIHIDCPLPEKKFSPSQLQPILKHAQLFHWDVPNSLYFASQDVQGILTAKKD